MFFGPFRLSCTCVSGCRGEAFLFKKFIYLFVWALSHLTWDLHYIMQDLSWKCMEYLVMACGLLSNCGAWLQSMQVQ